MTKEDDRRRSPRVSVVLKVDYSSAKDFLADYTCDASKSGLFIATDKKFELGDVVHFSISFPGLLVPIACKAKVQHVRPKEQYSDDRLNGVGVEFIFDSQEKAQAIEQLIQKLSEDNKTTPDSQDMSSSFRALLAEDNPLVLEMLHYGMKRFHELKMANEQALEVVEVADGLQAWEEIKRKPVDLAIVDFFMPVMNGGQLIRKIREDPDLTTTPIVAVSVGGKEAREASYAAGADLYLDKPLMLAILVESLHRLLRGRI